MSAKNNGPGKQSSRCGHEERKAGARIDDRHVSTVHKYIVISMSLNVKMKNSISF